jgi:hypothetical protein
LAISNAVLCVPATCTALTAGDDVLKPVVARYQGKVSPIYFRADAAVAMPEVYELLEAERIKYDPATGQAGSAEQDRLSAHAPSRTTSAPCAHAGNGQHLASVLLDMDSSVSPTHGE